MPKYIKTQVLDIDKLIYLWDRYAQEPNEKTFTSFEEQYNKITGQFWSNHLEVNDE